MSIRCLRGFFLGAIFLNVLGIICDSAEAGGRTGDYIAFRGIGGYSMVDGVAETSGGSLEIRNDTDIVGGMAIVIGYDWAGKGMPLRTELE